MRTRRTAAIAAAGIFCLVQLGCAATAALDRYPTRLIDRPITLPYDVDAWETRTVTTRVGGVPVPFPVPLYWQQSLSDDWTLLWALLPLAIRYQPVRTGLDIVGLEASLGGGFSVGGSYSSALLVPQLAVEWRRVLGEFIAIWTGGSFSPSFQFSNRSTSVSWFGEVWVQPVIQLTDSVAFGPRVRLTVFDFPAAEFDSAGRVVAVSRSTRVTWPMSATLWWRLHRQWELSGTYSNSFLGFARGRPWQDLQFSLMLYW